MSAVASDPLETAVSALAARCDGAVTDDHQGFNGADTMFGHSLASQVGRWTPIQRAAARTLVQKYRRQVLAATGIDVAEIQSFVVSAATPQAVVVPKTPVPVRKITARDVLGPGGSIAQRLPGYEHRESQLAMAALVEACIEAGEHGVVEAGTGTGKSLGYLVPAILSGKKTIVSTADKALQDQIFGKDIPFLQTVMPRPFTAALLKGRSNYLCLHRMGKLTDKALTTEPDFLAVTDKRSPDAARANATVWAMLQTWLETTASGDLDSLKFDLVPEIRSEVTVTSEECLSKKCPLYSSCYVEKAKKRAQEVDIVVVNHSLLVRDMAIRASTDGAAYVLPNADICIVDEGHHLEDRARDALGGEVTAARWHRIANRGRRLTVGHPSLAPIAPTRPSIPPLGETPQERIRRESEDRKRELEDEARRRKQEMDYVLARILWGKTEPYGSLIDVALREIKARFLPHGATVKLGSETMLSVISDMLKKLADVHTDHAPSWLDSGEVATWDNAVKLIRKLALDFAAVAQPDETGNTVRYAELGSIGTKYERVVLHVKPIDVASALTAMLFSLSTRTETYADGSKRTLQIGYRSVISTSATLADGDGFLHWRARVGLDHARELAVASPFDYQSHALLYLPADTRALDSSQWRSGNEATYFDTLASTIGALLAASKGRAFCLFTSNKALRECYDRLAYALPYRVLKQGDRPRAALLSEFRADKSSVLFATKSFWEGVDVSGESLSLVIIDKLPFTPPDDPLWEAKCAAINARTGDKWAWFNELAIPEATIALKQGVGRLIRSKTDTGVFAILDARLVSKKYGATVLRALPPAPVTQSLEDVQAFFER